MIFRTANQTNLYSTQKEPHKLIDVIKVKLNSSYVISHTIKVYCTFRQKRRGQKQETLDWKMRHLVAVPQLSAGGGLSVMLLDPHSFGLVAEFVRVLCSHCGLGFESWVWNPSVSLIYLLVQPVSCHFAYDFVIHTRDL
jgi:hypothetical protein